MISLISIIVPMWNGEEYLAAAVGSILEKEWKAVGRIPGAVLSHTDVEFINEGSPCVGHAWLPRTRALTALRLLPPRLHRPQ